MRLISSDSSRLIVGPISRIDLTPAHTTVMSSPDSAVSSADSSAKSVPMRCTPSKTPAEKTLIPAVAARCEADSRVVAALFPNAIAIASSRLEVLKMSSRVVIASNSASLKPICTSPLMTAIIAGIAPWARMIACTSRANSKFNGRGSPWLKIVDSRATMGDFDAIAAATSSEYFNTSLRSKFTNERIPPNVLTLRGRIRTCIWPI